MSKRPRRMICQGPVPGCACALAQWQAIVPGLGGDLWKGAGRC